MRNAGSRRACRLACIAEEGQIMIITGPVRDASLICGLTVGRAVNEKITGHK